MHRSTLILRWLTFSTLAACTSQTPTRGPGPTVVANIPATETAVAESSLDLLPPDLGYASLELPLVRRSDEPAAGLTEVNDNAFALITGDYRLDFGPAAPPDTILLSQAGSAVALALRPLGSD